MQLNKNASHCFASVYAAAMGVSANATKSVHLFVGDMPSKPELDALTVSALSNYSKAASISVSSPIFDNGFVLFDTMPLSAVSAVTGKLGWAAIEGVQALAVVDVGAVNEGAVVQVSDVNAVAGTPIDVLSITLEVAS